MALKLITEFVDRQELEVLQEAVEGGDKLLHLKGPFISVNEGNRNGRYYPESIMRPVVDQIIAEKVNNGSLYGEFGHPEGPKVNEDRISHIVKGLSWEGNKVLGDAVVIPAGLGEILHGIVKCGGQLGMSTRGLGSVKPGKNGLQEVQNDFKLITVDAVTDPSGVGCWQKGIMEDIDWVFNDSKGLYEGVTAQKLNDMVKEAKQVSKAEREQHLINIFNFALSEAAKPRNK
jgi:Kyanoviridae head maturation protease